MRGYNWARNTIRTDENSQKCFLLLYSPYILFFAVFALTSASTRFSAKQIKNSCFQALEIPGQVEFRNSIFLSYDRERKMFFFFTKEVLLRYVAWQCAHCTVPHTQ